MDRIDRWILDQLQQDADISNSDLADKVGLAPSSCLRRVQRLRETGVIEKTVALVNPRKMGRNLKAIVSVELTHHGKASEQDWLQDVLKTPAVSQAYTTTGEADSFVIFNLRDMEEFQELAAHLFGEDPMVQRYTTYFVLNSHKCDLAIPTDALE